jgi:hypothetical protein
MNQTPFPIALLTAGLLLAGALPAADTATARREPSPPAEATSPTRGRRHRPPNWRRMPSPRPSPGPSASRPRTPPPWPSSRPPPRRAPTSSSPSSVRTSSRAGLRRPGGGCRRPPPGSSSTARLAAQIEDETGDSALLVIGPDDWPFPIPLAKDDQGWFFDTAAGLEELLNRRIGRNEIHTLAAMRAFVEAQREYAAADPLGQGTPAFADRILSTEGQARRTLLAHRDPESPQSPLGPLSGGGGGARVMAPPPTGEGPRPFHGYLYKVLTAQGEQAPGGAMSYSQGRAA